METNNTLPNMTTTPNLAKAIINVMKEVRNIEKGLTVGTGSSAYKGVADKDVKYALSESMAKNGLCILPIGINAVETVTRWEVEYNEQKQQKQSVFTKVDTKYLLLHETGESIEIVGHGHGVDSQDKSAGKATTYALKYALLYTFMIATGNIDDADKEASEVHEVPKVAPKAKSKPTATDKAISKACDKIMTGEENVIEKMKAAFALTTEQLSILESTQLQFNKEAVS